MTIKLKHAGGIILKMYQFLFLTGCFFVPGLFMAFNVFFSERELF
jgi:hypothetical protein